MTADNLICNFFYISVVYNKNSTYICVVEKHEP